MKKEQQILDHSRAQLIDNIIALSRTGELVWDFTYFENFDRGCLAIAETENILLISGASQSNNVDFSILLKESNGEITELDNIKGNLAHKIRNYLERTVNNKHGYEEIELRTNGLIFANSLLKKIPQN